MKKSDLKQGMVLENRAGNHYLYLETMNGTSFTGSLCGFHGKFCELQFFEEDLICCGDHTLDIVKVYEGPKAYDLYKKETGDLLWERPQEVVPEKTVTINGKEFSESTILAALKAYVS